MHVRDRFPRLAEYLDALPDGLDSYPDCRSKGSLIRSALEGHDPNELLPDLPDALAAHVRQPPLNGSWTPAVHNTAMFYAICDRYYPTEAAMDKWARLRTRGLATGLYRGLMRVTGPRVFFRFVERTHGLLQQGSGMTILTMEATRLVVRLSFPPNLHTRFMLLSNPPVYEVLGEFTGAKDTKVTMGSWDETSAVYECRWR